MVLCTRSAALLWGWLTDDLVTLMPNLLKKVVVNSLVKEVPRSDCISRGNPILEKILKRASITYGEFSTDIRYTKGSDNTVADALSRIEIDEISPTVINFKEFASAQSDDEELQKF
ncbi:hypothetical protein TNCV_265071 [Trichonephila clavipes]|nr:hypothetical protein TNCV_265071 [Trichonephila clavipes]